MGWAGHKGHTWRKTNQDHNVGPGKGTLQPWEVCPSQKQANTFHGRSFPTPALGRCEHPCGMSCSKKYCKDVSECFANSAAVVQRVYPTTANNQELLGWDLQRFAKVVLGLPRILGVFWFWGWFCFALPIQVQFLALMTGGDKQCCQHTFQVRVHLLYHILKE